MTNSSTKLNGGKCSALLPKEETVNTGKTSQPKVSIETLKLAKKNNFTTNWFFLWADGRQEQHVGSSFERFIRLNDVPDLVHMYEASMSCSMPVSRFAIGRAVGGLKGYQGKKLQSFAEQFTASRGAA
jgi:hypothetical protein